MKFVRIVKLLQFILLLVSFLAVSSFSFELDFYELNHNSEIDLPSRGQYGKSMATKASPTYCYDCTCGENRRISRIVNGQIADPNEFPWAAELLYEGKHWCGASLISRKHLLTVAHCVYGYDIRDFTVRLRDRTEFRVMSMVYKQNYIRSNRTVDDIALIELNRQVDLTGVVSTVCLPTESKYNYSGEVGTVIGWGKTEEEGLLSKELRKVELPIIPQEVCRSSTGYEPGRVTDKMFCAGHLDGTKMDACFGDSGGAFHMDSDSDVTEIVGLVSFGRGCARSKYPGIYTKVSSYLRWISKHLHSTCLCPPPNYFSYRRVKRHLLRPSQNLQSREKEEKSET